MSREIIEKQAKYLAAQNKQNDPDITEVFWFPDDEEVRLVEVTEMIPISTDGEIQAFYFRPNPAEHLPAPSGIALIRPSEVRKLQPPRKWGGWEAAVRIEDAA